jgi:acyl-CoA reductase-like NAD-dependent aldehyde dehydrogenase
MAEQGANLIGGRWQPGRGPEVVTTRDPATGEALAEYAVSTAQDVDDAVAAAGQAFLDWRRVPAPARGKLLYHVAEELAVVKDELARTMTREMGKLLAETTGELDATLANCRLMAGEGSRALGQVLPAGSESRSIHTLRVPVGVVACITPWNYPISLAAYKIFAALVSGNTVVWKPAANVSGSAALFVAALERAGIPAGVVNLLAGGEVEAGRRLCSHPGVGAVAFTGSTEVGIDIAKVCAETLIPVSLELGGKNAVIVLEDADLQAAATGIMQSGFATSGQRCTAASRVIVQRSVSEPLAAELARRSSRLTLGHGLDPAVNVGPLASDGQLKHVTEMVDAAVEAGATVVAGGRPAELADYPAGMFYLPTILTGVQADDPIAQAEVFGPVVAVIEVDSYEEAVEVNNSTRYGLSSAIYTQSLHYAQRAMTDLDSGLVYVNSGTSAAEDGVPFGGTRLSGNGQREVSAHAFQAMTELKSVYVNF